MKTNPSIDQSVIDGIDYARLACLFFISAERRNCLGQSIRVTWRDAKNVRPFVSDTLQKSIDREGLG